MLIGNVWKSETKSISNAANLNASLMTVCLKSWYVLFLSIVLPNLLISGSAFQGLRKTIPGSPEGQPQVHEKLHPIYKPVQK